MISSADIATQFSISVFMSRTIAHISPHGLGYWSPWKHPLTDLYKSLVITLPFSILIIIS